MDDLSQASDAALVVAIGRWRDDALAEAYRRHGGAVFALAGRLLGETVIAEEVVQDVFLRRRRPRGVAATVLPGPGAAAATRAAAPPPPRRGRGRGRPG